PSQSLFYGSRHLVLLHSFPTRRSSDLFAFGFDISAVLAAIRLERRGDRFQLSASARFLLCVQRFDQQVNVFPAKKARARAELESDRKSTRLNSSHDQISYAVFCLKKKK